MSEILDAFKSLGNKENSNPMEVALSKTLVLLTKEIVKRTILPKRAIKNLALLNNDIFFREVILDYKENLKDTKKILKIYQNIIKFVANGINKESERKGLLNYVKGKF